MKKRGKGGRGKAAKKAAEEVQDEEEEAIIRCICGYVVEDPNDKRAMICCDKCLAWQHNVCMGLSTDDEDLPDTYFCEQCKPEDHKETLAALAKGEPIWETRQAEEQREEEERKSRKRKGGRKSKGGRVSEVAPVEKKEAAPTPQKKKEVTPVETQPPPSPIAETPTAPTPKPVKVETGSKRKTPTELPLDASHANDSVCSCPFVAITSLLISHRLYLVRLGRFQHQKRPSHQRVASQALLRPRLGGTRRRCHYKQSWWRPLRSCIVS